jgi:hypothetical protein
MLIITLLTVLPALGQKFTMNGESSTILFTDNSSYTLYNEDDFNFIDSSNIYTLVLTQNDACSMDLDRRMVVHGSLLSSTNTSFVLQNNEQWKLVIVEDFQNQIKGWSYDTLSSCGNSPDLFLGGHCKLSNQVVSKNFTLPAHSYVKFQMNFHFLDKWQGNSAYLQIDGKFVWVETYNAISNFISNSRENNGLNACGDSYSDRLAYPVKYVGKHSNASLNIQVFTNLDSSTDPCEVSWGIDDIQIYIK